MDVDAFSVKCQDHGKLCMIKTGVTDGPSKGKSFLVCSNSHPCDFRIQLRQEPKMCSKHGKTIELACCVDKNGERRLYQRCLEGRESHSWCFFTLKPKISLNSENDPSLFQKKPLDVARPLKDINQLHGKSHVNPQGTNKPEQNVMASKSTSQELSETVMKAARPVVKQDRIWSESAQKTAPSISKNEVHKPYEASQKVVPSMSKNALHVFSESAQIPALPHSKNDFQMPSESARKLAPFVRQDDVQELFISEPVKAPGPNQGEHAHQPAAQTVCRSADLQPGHSQPADTKGRISTEKTEISQDARQNLQATYILKEIEKKTDLLRMADRLPDKGEKIRNQVAGLKKALEELRLSDCNNGLASSGSVDHTEPLVKQPPLKQSGEAAVKTCELQELPLSVFPSAHRQMYSSFQSAPLLYGGRMNEKRLQLVTSVTSEAIESLHKQLETCPPPDTESCDPNQLRVPLMKHQRQALIWLRWREMQVPAGGILADDMGLGKTLTMISLVLADKQIRQETQHKQPEWLDKGSVFLSDATLVVCPASLIHQWFKELENKCARDALKVLLYHGPDRESNLSKLGSADLVLTTYNLVAKEIAVSSNNKQDRALQEMAVKDVEVTDGDGPLVRIAWRRIILDEAHNIKNNKSTTALSICRLRAKFRWALTGTPIQNDLLDMYSLLRFLRCSPFDELKVWKKWVDNKEASGNKRLTIIIKCLLLRRTKDQKTADGLSLVPLPQKSTHLHELQLCGREKDLYDQLFEKSKGMLVKYLQQQDTTQVTTIAQPNGHVKGDTILLCLLRLRQCCSHPALTKEILNQEEATDDGIELDLLSSMKELTLRDNVGGAASTILDDIPVPSDSGSSKIDALLQKIKHLKAISHKDKFVVVSQWTAMLDIVAKNLDREGIKYLTIKGDVSPKKRAEMVQDFNDNPDSAEVMLVSLRAGGVGLNLVGGSHLFLMDLHWNPALEQQACDRIYRVGQKRDVHIHKFICKDTLEEKILVLQKNKLEMAESALTGTSVTAASKLSLRDLKTLFGIIDQP